MQLDWFGDLALAPKEGPEEARSAVLAPAWRTLAVYGAGLTWYGLLGLAGLFGLVLGFVLVVLGYLRFGLTPGPGRSTIYLETFTLWMVLFIILGFAAGQLAPRDARFLFAAAASVLSLAVLAWPVVRGVPWTEMRHEIGLTAGRRPLLEPIIGFGCYAMMLPLMGAALIVTVLLVRRQLGGATDSFEPADMPSHPAVEWLARASWRTRLEILLLGCVTAPLIEEIMFRGVLHRHLRDTMPRLAPWLSILLSGTIVSFVFAVIHPQGLVAVPALMVMAIGFTLAREWRGTLVPAMMAHGISNGVNMILAMVALGM
jgi:membrane protease YdiL (CAAX protease family)